MKYRNIFGIIVGTSVLGISTVVFVFLSLLITSIFASANNSGSNIISGWKDTYILNKKTQVYGNNYSIAIVTINPSNLAISGDVPLLIKGIYYYFINELGFSDIPYNYIVSWNGQVYKGMSGGEGVQVPRVLVSSNQPNGIITIGYLLNYQNPTSTLTTSGKTALINLLSTLMQSNYIPKSNISTYGYQIDGTSLKFIPYQSANMKESALLGYINNFIQLSNLPNIKVQKSSLYPFVIPHTINIVSISTPPNLPPSGIATIGVKIKNTGTTPIIGDLSLNTNNSSDLAVIKDWKSASQVQDFKNINIQPGSFYNLNFNILDPKTPGNFNGSFYFENLMNQIVGSNFNLPLDITASNIQSPSNTQSTGTIINPDGKVNLYLNPSLLSSSTSIVTNTSVTIIKHSPGWYEVKIQSDGSTGWVISAYLQNIQ